MNNRKHFINFLVSLSISFISSVAYADLQLTQEIEPNGTSATATVVNGTSRVLQGSIYPNADIDFYSFTATAGDRLYAATMTSASASSSVDSTLELIDTDGSTVLEADTDNGVLGATSSSIAGTVIPSTGTYYLRVVHASATSQIRPYKLFFQLRSGSPTAETEPNDIEGEAVLPISGWVNGEIDSAIDVDHYDINLNAGDTVFLSLDLDPERDTTEWNGVLGLGSFGFPATVIKVDDAGSGTPDSEAFFMTVKEAGTYSVFVGANTTFGTYQLNVSVFPAVNATSNCTTYTSTDVPQVIPTGPGSVSSTITIPGNPRIEDMNVSIQLDHNFMADIDAHLVSPAGNDNGIFTDVGSVTVGAQTGMDMVLDDEAAIPAGQFTILDNMVLQPEAAYRLSWYDGENAGGVWTLTLRDDATGDGGTLTGWSIQVCEPEPKEACAPGYTETTVYSTDFESGDAGFTHSGTADEWELGLPAFAPITTCNSGSNCWKTDLDNTYAANSSQDLLSPNIDLAGLVAPIYVNWLQRYNMESANFDHFYVDAQQVGGSTPIRLFEWDGATMTSTVGNPTTTISESAGWGSFSRRVDDLAGLNSEIIFHLDSDSTVQNTGLAIDDVSVTACRLLSADLAISKTDGVASAIAGDSVSYTIVATNTGSDDAPGSTVTDNFPMACDSVDWTCVGAGGATCTAMGSGNISDSVNLPAGGSVTYTATCNLAAGATGNLINSANVSNAIVSDPDGSNNTASDTDSIETPTPTPSNTPTVSPTNTQTSTPTNTTTALATNTPTATNTTIATNTTNPSATPTPVATATVAPSLDVSVLKASSGQGALTAPRIASVTNDADGSLDIKACFKFKFIGNTANLYGIGKKLGNDKYIAIKRIRRNDPCFSFKVSKPGIYEAYYRQDRFRRSSLFSKRLRFKVG